MITNRIIPDGAIVVERNGITFLAHPFLRFDPLTIGLIAAGAGTAVQVAGTLKQGKQAEKIAEARADVDLKNADAVREQSVERAKITAERGQRLKAEQLSKAGASGIRINVGSPLVLKAETRAIIAKDVGFILKEGRVQETALRRSAQLERFQGKQIKKQSQFSAIGQGLLGIGSIAFMGLQGGLFGGKAATTALPQVGSVTPQAGATLARF